MSIKVYNNPVAKPKIEITGKLINADNGQVGNKSTISVDQSSNVNGNTVQATQGAGAGTAGLLTFHKGVTIAIDPNDVTLRAALQTPDYNNANAGISSKTFQGKQYELTDANTIASVNNIAYIYYTLNGKDPSRTKNNLYTGPVKFNSNLTGDNITIKARTYYQGKMSGVSVARINIARQIDSTEV